MESAVNRLSAFLAVGLLVPGDVTLSPSPAARFASATVPCCSHVVVAGGCQSSRRHCVGVRGDSTSYTVCGVCW